MHTDQFSKTVSLVLRDYVWIACNTQFIDSIWYLLSFSDKYFTSNRWIMS